MGRAPCCEKVGLKKGRWTAEEDQILVHYIKAHGEGSWRSLPKKAGLLRCGKSCRLRWINYLREDLKRGNISGEEEDIIIKLRATLGNRWSVIAGHLPGRTDNEIKNYWNSHLSKKVQESNKNKDEPNANQAVANSRKVGRPRGCKKKNSLKVNSNKEKSERCSKKTPSDDKEVGMAIVSQTHEANNEILLMNEHDIINGSGVSVVNGVSGEEEREGGNCKSSSCGKKDDGGGEIEVFDEGGPLLEEIELVDWELEEIASRLWEEEGEVRPWILGDESEVFGGILEMGEFGLFKDVAWDNWLLHDVL